jgi:hypothetical protein
MSVENIYCNMELHGGKGFQPPPAAPQASLERASHLAKASLTRRSQLGRTSNLGRTSETRMACSVRSIDVVDRWCIKQAVPVVTSVLIKFEDYCMQPHLVRLCYATTTL